MKKTKLYLDTSVPSFLFADDSPEKREVTIQFWDVLKLGIYAVVISDVLLTEISKCEKPLAQDLENRLTELVLEIVSVNEDVYSLAQKYIDEGIIPQTYQDDALHIALATFNEADALISWNFKHMVKLKTICSIDFSLQNDNSYPIKNVTLFFVYKKYRNEYADGALDYANKLLKQGKYDEWRKELDKVKPIKEWYEFISYSAFKSKDIILPKLGLQFKHEHLVKYFYKFSGLDYYPEASVEIRILDYEIIRTPGTSPEYLLLK